MRATTFLLITVTLLSWCSQSSCALRILAIFPMNGKSHFNMDERLVKGLAAKGHQVDVYSHFPQKKPLPNYTDFSLEGSMPNLLNNMTYEYAVQFYALNMQMTLDTVGNPFCELMGLPVLQRLIKNPPKYDVVIVEPFLSICYLAWGRYLNIPMVITATMQLLDWVNEPLGNPFNTAIIPSAASNAIHPMNFWERLSNTFLSKLVSDMFSMKVRVQDVYVERYFGKGFPNVMEMLKDLDLVLVNTDMALNGAVPYTPAVVPVGGMHIDDKNVDLSKEHATLQKWLDDSKDGCIYVTFGSMIKIESLPKPIIESLYASFKRIAPIKVLLKIAKPEELTPGLPSNVMNQSWFPQVQVLKHKNIKVFVSHGGLMSTQEAIYFGVPMIVIPVFGDQHHNAKMNVRRGIAIMIQLDNITEEKLTTAIKDIVHNPAYKANVEKLSRQFVDKPMKPLDTAIFWVEYIARHGKQALRSPLVDMPWWQAQLLDVYGFVIFVLFSAVLLLRFLVRKCCCASRKKDLNREDTSASRSKSNKNR